MIYEESFKELPDRLKLFEGDMLNLKSDAYKVDKLIGEGGFGAVYSIVGEKGQRTFGIKIISMWEFTPDQYKKLNSRFKTEFEIGKINSGFLVESYYMGFIKGNPYMIMELCTNGNLKDNFFRFNNDEGYKEFCFSILSGLKDLHENGIIHRDIKPENILFDRKNKLKITDFGISAHLNDRKTKINFFGKVKDGFMTPLYSPPEQSASYKYFKYTLPSMDIFAFGVTLYYVISGGKHPFGELSDYLKSPKDYIDKKWNSDYTPLNVYNSYVSSEWIEFVQKCLEPKPENRFQSVDEALKHLNLSENKFGAFKSNGDLVEYTTLLQLNGKEHGKVYNLDGIVGRKNNSIITVGRKNQVDIFNDINIEEEYSSYISKKHCTFFQIQGNWFVRDGHLVKDESDNVNWQNSVNGTLINQTLYKTELEAVLKHGDLIRLGEINFKFLLAS